MKKAAFGVRMHSGWGVVVFISGNSVAPEVVESGHGARPMQKQWVISIQRQCEQSGVAFFFKQWGGVHKSKAGRVLEGRTYDEMPTDAPYVSDEARCSTAL